MGILIVDDDNTMRTACRTLLEQVGFTPVWTARSATEAFTFLDRAEGQPNERVEVILMDIILPEINGIEACRRLKADQRFRDIPVLMVTGLTDDRELEEAFSAGAMDYITKPIKVIEMLARLRSALTLKRELDQRKARQVELVDLTRKLREVNHVLERLSTQDELTGLPNRRAFGYDLEREWARAQREQTPIGLVMMDIDFFKGYNDCYGHLQGDECLRKVARSLHGQLRRAGDVVARYGGEEFISLLPHTDGNGARRVAETFHQGVARLHLDHRASPIQDHVTLSLGVSAMIPKRHSTPEDLIRLADHALYEAKHLGRNQIVMGCQEPVTN